MLSKVVISLAACIAAFPVMTLAHERGFFAGIDTTVGIAQGSSSTKNGSGFGGGGVANDVKFGNTVGIGAHVGYQFDHALSALISYQHTQGDVDWRVDFPTQATNISGTATSNAILLNLAYDWHASDDTIIRATAGAGPTFNTLSKMTETQEGEFLSNPEKHTMVSPMVQLGASIQHYLSPRAVLSLNATVAYTGGFRTGDTRTGNLGRTNINPYKIDDVWRAGLGVSMQVRF